MRFLFVGFCFLCVKCLLMTCDHLSFSCYFLLLLSFLSSSCSSFSFSVFPFYMPSPSPLPPFMSLIHVDCFYMLCELLTNLHIFHSSPVSDLSRVKLPNTSEAVSCLYILLNKSWHLVSEVLLSPTPQLVSLCSVVSRLFFTLGSRIILSNHTHMLYTSIKILVKMISNLHMNLQRVAIFMILNIFIYKCCIFLH